MRDDKWLFSLLDEIWDNYFQDVPQDNHVRIVWGRRARNRLGSIKVDSQKVEKRGLISLRKRTPEPSNHPDTVITINSLFKDPRIPEFVVFGTIAHELVHYAHGFHSPLEQKYQTPHAGGVIRKEMADRGLLQIYNKQKKWLKENWREFVQQEMKPVKRRKRRYIIKWL